MEVDLNFITSKINNKKECRKFCEKNGNKFFIIGLVFPELKCFNCEHFYEYLSGQKMLLKESQKSEVIIPKYVTLASLQKKALFEYCKSNLILKKFLPESSNEYNISREFLLQVSFF